jgi:general secretion pathway protein K
MRHVNMMANSRRNRKQRGVAIITALLVVALGTITIVSLVARQQYSLLREQNEGVMQQARTLAISGERFAAAVLYRDFQAALRDGTDSLDDDWAQTIPPIPVDNASLQGCIVDMQGHFNLNSVIDAEGNAAPAYVGILQRLLVELSIDVTKADAIVDWIDSNIDPTLPEGAEDDYYSGLTPAYRTANGPMVSVSELQLVKGFSSQVPEEFEDYKLLLPHVSALPVDQGPTPINVNTATPEVISAMSDFLQPLGSDLSRWDSGAYADYPACEDIFSLDAVEGPETLGGETRDLTPYSSVLVFDDEAAPGSGEEVAPPGSYGVTSRFFQLRIDVISEAALISQYTLLERDNEGKTRVIYRSRDTL